MRGIERFLAAILLMGAVGGAAAFARYAGTEPAPPAFHLSASPRQHLTIPQTVVEIPLPAAPRRAAAKPVVAERPRLRLAPTVPARRAVVAPVSTPEPTPAAPAPTPPPVQAPTPAPTPAPPVAAPAAPVPVAAPAAPRGLAAVPVEPDAATASTPRKHGHGAGKAKGHDKSEGDQGDDNGDDDAGAPPAEQPCAAAPVDQAAAAPVPGPTEPGPTDENGDPQGDAGHGNGDGNGNGNGNGHGHGHGHGG